tara:strand:+ start:3386 stop:4333 length:948 start_codon:yes stop_codon:yes gene_type:complete
MKSIDLLLIGAGKMASNYVDVLRAQSINFETVCRNKKTAENFKKSNNINPFYGGIDFYIKNAKFLPKHAIICVDEINLHEVTISLIKSGVKNLLVEKPGGLNNYEINSIYEKANQYSSNVLIAYNRRFYESVELAKEIIKQDGGLRTSFFEFTEWTHYLDKIDKKALLENKILLCNSSHIIDLFLYFCGNPEDFSAFYSGGIFWNKNASAFSGSGITDKGIVFSYISDWESAGRWNLELTTNKRRLYFSPLEKLFCTDRGKLNKYEIEAQTNLDVKFKPGIYKMVKFFMNNIHKDFCSINDQKKNFKILYKIANY